jgi:adenylate cyclase
MASPPTDVPSQRRDQRTQQAQLAHLRHELRTPLNAILGYSEMLMEDLAGAERPGLLTDLRRIHHAGSELVGLVSQLLDPGAIAARGELDPAALAAELRRELITPLNTVIGYAEMLLEEIIGADLEDRLAPDLHSIAEAARSFLGLVHDADGLLGAGPLDVKASDQALARDAVASIPSLEAAPPAAAAAAGRILVVDDNPINRHLLRRSLEREGHEVTSAENGVEALEILGTQRFDLLLLDVMMPEMNGFEVLHHLRDTEAWREIPVIMISALDEMDSVVRCIEMGAEDYLPKPFNPVLLKARIGACLEKKRLHDLERENQQRLQELNAALEVRNRFIRETFGRYLSDEVVERLLESPAGRKLGGQKRVVTALMADLRGFTTISERLPAEDVVNVINNFLEEMTDIIFKHQGTIDEFIGDSILAVFGAPILREDDARRAVACAVEMQLAMPAVNERNRRAGYPTVAMGIGINTGSMVVGNIGSRRRTKYGVVGREIVLASRIESCTIGGQILISESTARACGPILRIDDELTITPKGVRDPVRIYAVGGIGGDYDLQLPLPRAPTLSPVEPPRPVRVAVIEGKRVGEASYDGELVGLGRGIARIACDAPVVRLDNVRIALVELERTVVEADLYGKVMRLGDAGTFEAAFTAGPPEAMAYLDGLVGGRSDEGRQG